MQEAQAEGEVAEGMGRENLTKGGRNKENNREHERGNGNNQVKIQSHGTKHLK